MNLRESLILALGSLRTNKMRSFLTLLGIIVGIASVIAILTLGHALQVQTNRSIASSGANDLTVQVKERPDPQASASPSNDPYGGLLGGSGANPDTDSKFDVDDINLIKQVMGDSIAGIPIGDSGYGGSYMPLTANGNQASGSAKFVNEDALKLKPLEIVAGRNISAEDINTSRKVAVISTETVNALYDGDPQKAVGSEITMDGTSGSMTGVVIGVYAPDTSGGIFSYTDTSAYYMPYTVASAVSDYETTEWSTITVRPSENADLAQTKAKLQAVLTQMYRSNDNFQAEIMDFSASTASFNQVLNNISMAISAIAGISLLVGGIGVMNIMLVTVTERTREIGIRKALGATRSAIRTQFVVEAMMVCLVGGLLGVLLGGALGMLGSNLMGLMVLPPLNAVLTSLGFSLAIGLFFGYYPANKAAKLDPIDALRYE